MNKNIPLAIISFIVGALVVMGVLHFVNSPISPTTPTNPTVIADTTGQNPQPSNPSMPATTTPPVVVPPAPTPTPTPTPAPAPVTTLKKYTDAKQHFAISYPSTSVIQTGDTTNQGASDIGNGVVQLNVPQTYTQGTNLSEAFVLVSASSSPYALAHCYDRFAQDPEQPSNQTINGIPFKTKAYSDAAAGNRYTSYVYLTVHNNTCYEVTEFIHYGNIGNYDPGTVKEFDEAAVTAELVKMLKSFQFTN